MLFFHIFLFFLKDHTNQDIYFFYFLSFRIPSTIHAIGSAAIAIKLLWIDDIFQGDVINAYSPWCDYMMAFSMGYEFYDFIVMYLQTGASYGMYVHHLCLCVAYLLSFVCKKYSYTINSFYNLLTNLFFIDSFKISIFCCCNVNYRTYCITRKFTLVFESI